MIITSKLQATGAVRPNLYEDAQYNSINMGSAAYDSPYDTHNSGNTKLANSADASRLVDYVSKYVRTYLFLPIYAVHSSPVI